MHESSCNFKIFFASGGAAQAAWAMNYAKKTVEPPLWLALTVTRARFKS